MGLDEVSLGQGESGHPALILLMEGDYEGPAGGLLSSSSPGQFLHVSTLQQGVCGSSCSCTHPKGYVGTHHAACDGGKATSHHSMDL